MTQRQPVSSVQNLWFDSEQVDAENMVLEQNYNNTIQGSLINNQIGSGVLPEVLEQNILFNSALVSGELDGMNILPQNQPSDSNLGNQLQITLTGSAVAGQKTIKLAIIGLDFQGNLQYDTFVFAINESQYTQKHYTNIITILFNDFIGNPTQSFNLGGTITISEAKPFTISRDPISASQDVQPNLFFRDFFTANGQTLNALLTSALPLYNISALNINTGILANQIISAGDVTTQIGEKFLANTNNIQKITLLLSVQNSAPGQSTNLVWSGDLIISIYQLQSTVNCITDIIPNLPIEYSPYNIPLAQISYNYNTLQAVGITLDGIPQPIDFVFSNTQVANGTTITPNGFYAVTVKRSGSASTCDILIAAGANISANSRVTTFVGSNWVDIPTQDLWYRVYSDAIQVTDGQAYSGGQGLIIPKTIINPTTNSPEDYSLNNISFSGTSNAIYTAVLSSTIQNSNTVQDQRTGNNVYSAQQYVPNVELLNVIDLQNLEASTEPLILGVANDKNIKTSAGTSTAISASIHAWTFVDNTLTIKMIDDTTDPRYDLNVLALVSYLNQGSFVNARITPDQSNPNLYYRISEAQLSTMIYGDVNGDGIVDTADLNLLDTLMGANLNSSPPLNSQITTVAGYTTVVNGYEALANVFVNATGVSFQVVNSTTGAVYTSASDGYLVVNPTNGSLASFQSASTDFYTISDPDGYYITDYSLVITAGTTQVNIGEFGILGVALNEYNVIIPNVIDIQKLYITPESIQQIMRGDINGDFQITSEDGYLIENYIQKVPPFPATSLPASKIGTPFNVLTITIDPFTYLNTAQTITNRTDDYPATAVNRATALHTTQDIFINDGYMQSHNYYTQPLPFNILPQFSWVPYLMTSNGNGRFVPTIFTAESGLVVPQCMVPGITSELYSDPPTFDPGVINCFVPNNLIIGNGGEMLNPDGSNYKVDFEVGTILLEIPISFDGYQQSINLFNSFVASYNGQPTTIMGFPAMKFSDCSLVPPTALANNQVFFNVALQSFYPNINGIDSDGYTGVVVDGRIGVFMDRMTGILTLDFANLNQDPVLLTLNTKIQITVYLKKAGFNNPTLFVDSTTVANLLALNAL